jgi:hypothetical protein
MDDEQKSDDLEEKVVEENLTDEKEELETLLKAIEELEEMKKREGTLQKKSNKYISIEFGSVFHRNFYINFVFNFILNLTLIFLVIELFNFAEYTHIMYIVILALTYTFFETIYRIYVLYNHFSFVIKSIGFVFYFGYVGIFYLLDVSFFEESFNFYNETLLVVFVGIFTLIRYIIGSMLIRSFRKRNLR